MLTHLSGATGYPVIGDLDLGRELGNVLVVQGSYLAGKPITLRVTQVVGGVQRFRAEGTGRGIGVKESKTTCEFSLFVASISQWANAGVQIPPDLVYVNAFDRSRPLLARGQSRLALRP